MRDMTGLKPMFRAVFAAFALAAVLFASPAFAAGPFDNWAALVVAGDSRAQSGADSPVFDNARRDLVTALKKMGFAEDHIQQFSVHPERDPDGKALKSDGATIYRNFENLTDQVTGGCFVYFTSHGAPLGIVIGPQLVAIRSIGDVIDNSCHDRPAIIVISACFSGMFIPVLRANNRFILTAARPDRASFGCAEDLQYTFFDQCVLETLPTVEDFVALADKAKTCVADRETKEMVMPPSEPQLYVGTTIAPALTQTYRFMVR